MNSFCCCCRFDGHSFASGLFPFADGKSQESSSEAINCYYGAYLWSLMRGGGTINESNSDEVNYHKLLLAMEIRGAKTYWHMVPPNKTAGMESLHSGNIYDPTFESSYMVGNLGMMDVTIATWFGTKPLYVHMINLMPVTSITRELFNKKYVEEEFYNIIEPSYDEVEMAWRGYTIADRGMIDPNGAWKDAAKLRSFELDSAVSKSQIYYWLSTSDGFIPSRAHNKTYEEITAPSQSNDAASASCVANERCTDIGLKGKCCPTSDGTFLGCCNK
jgi:endo-1,3(4)-beta-glucanase